MPDESHSYAVEPEPQFAERLERRLLERLQVAAEQSPTPPAPSAAATADTIADTGADTGADTAKDDAIMVDLSARTTTQIGRPPVRWVVGIAAAVLVAAAAGIVIARGNSDDSSPPAATAAVDVAFEIAWPDLNGLEQPECLDSAVGYSSAQNLRCFRRFDGEVDLTGDVTGSALWLMLGNLGKAADTADSAVEIPATFTATYIVKATVAGCGTGEFMISEQLRFDGWESGAFSGAWQIVPGSGRDDLTSISGGGTVPGEHPDQGAAQSDRTGQIQCP